MSSREVKSIGEKARVVILPSTVIAKVAATRGRLEILDPPLRRGGVLARRRGTKAAPTLFVLRDFMLQRFDFPAHFPQLHVPRLAARFVKEINDPPGSTAGEHDQKTH